jgi:hypothetical protein
VVGREQVGEDHRASEVRDLLVAHHPAVVHLADHDVCVLATVIPG